MTDLRFLDLGNNDLAAVDLSGQRTRVGENARNSKLYALWLHNNLLTSIDLSGLTALRDRTDGASHPNYVSLRLDRNQLTSVTGLADLRPGTWSLRLENKPADLGRPQGRGASPLCVPEQQPDLEHRGPPWLLSPDQSPAALPVRDEHLVHRPFPVLTPGESLSQRQQPDVGRCHRTGQHPEALAEGEPDNPDHRAARHRRHRHLPQPEDESSLVDRPVGAGQPPPAVSERQPAHRGGLEPPDPAGGFSGSTTARPRSGVLPTPPTRTRSQPSASCPASSPT